MADLIDQGLYFGYPLCCIAAFLSHHAAITHAFLSGDVKRGWKLSDDAPQGPWTGTGFLPCPACQQAIGRRKRGLEAFVAEKITPNRKCDVPFPEGE